MNKVLLLVVFAVGILCGFYLNNNKFESSKNKSHISPSLVSDVEQKNPSPSLSDSAPVVTEVAAGELIKFLSAKTPKTQFEDFLAFQKLAHLSPKAIEQMLLSLDSSQLELQGKVAWFFAGKFPDQAFLLMETSMGDNNLELARVLFSQLSVNQPEKVFDWLQNNENDFAFLFPISEQQLDRKMVVYQALSVFPDWKWAAYEEGVALVKSGVMPQNKWAAIGLAQTVAKANPLDALNYALEQHSGAVDRNLLNGALVEYAKISPFEAKRLLLENQEYLDDMAVTAVSDRLLYQGHFDEAYDLVASLKDAAVAESAATRIAGNIYNYGSEKVIDFVASIKDPKLKIKAVGSATSSMSVVGYPVDRLLDVLNAGLRDVPVEDKAFSYAWTLKNGYKDNPQALAAYMEQMRINNKELAVKVEEMFGYMKDS